MASQSRVQKQPWDMCDILTIPDQVLQEPWDVCAIDFHNNPAVCTCTYGVRQVNRSNIIMNDDDPLHSFWDARSWV